MSAPLDRDTRDVIALLSHAAESSGLSRAAFARALGTSAPRLSTYISGATKPTAQFLVRSRRIGGALAAANEGGLMSAPATSIAMRRAIRAHDVSWTWRMLLQGRDHLRRILAVGDELSDAWEAQPVDVGDPGWQALLAAVTAHEFDRSGRIPPQWSQIEPLAEDWAPEHPFLSETRVRQSTPAWLRRLNIYVPERDLVTA